MRVLKLIGLSIGCWVLLASSVISLAQQRPSLTTPWYARWDVPLPLFGEVRSIQGVWLDRVDSAYALPWRGNVGVPAAKFVIKESDPDYQEWHTIIIKGTAIFSSIAPGLSLTGILAEYDPPDNEACVLSVVMKAYWGDFVGNPGVSGSGERYFTIYFPFTIYRGSIYGEHAGVKALFSDQQAESTLREGSSANPAELVIFLGDWVLPMPRTRGGWTWWEVTGTP